MIGPPSEAIIDRLRDGRLRPLIVNLYSVSIGYSVVFPSADGRKWTTRCFNYEDEPELLEDVENNRLPLFLIDLIDRYCSNSPNRGAINVFYEGCIGVEIRDFRRRQGTNSDTTDEKFDQSYSVLRPTIATLLNDLENLQRGYEVMEKRHEMEEMKEKPNCMETADSVFCRQAKYDNQRLSIEADFWTLISASRTDQRQSGGGIMERVNRRLYKHLRYDVRARRKREERLRLEQHFPIMQWIINNVNAKEPGQSLPLVRLMEQPRQSTANTAATSQWKPMIPSMVKTPMEIAEKRLQREQMRQEQRQGEGEDQDSELVEEYCVEMPTVKYKTRTRIRLLKRILDSVYIGQLRVERGENAGSTASVDTEEQQEQELDAVTECSFILGTEASSRSYVRQYLDMVSEGGRRPITLTRRLPGRPPQTMPTGTRGVTAIPCQPNMPVIIPVQDTKPLQQFIPLV